jgi:hypothetical protein
MPRPAILLLSFLPLLGLACADNDPPRPAPLQPLPPTSATTRRVTPATTRTSTAPVTNPSDHHTAPPRRTGP